MTSRFLLTSMAAVLAAATLTTLSTIPSKAQDAAARGKYLVGLMGCGDCHTPGYFLGKPDMNRQLSGSEVGFEIPGLGVFHGANLTTDKETGLGKWSKQQIVTAITTGKRPDGRELAPAIPWRSFASLTPEDADAIASYLQSLEPVVNKVPGPFGPHEKPTGFVMRVHPPGQ